MASLCSAQKDQRMTLLERIDALVALGEIIQNNTDELNGVIQRAYLENKWFTPENCKQALDGIVSHFLQKNTLEEWSASYQISDSVAQKKIGLILAGNIPLVGFHDMLCVFISGHQSLIKLSDKDKYLIPYLIKLLEQINGETASYFQCIERLQDYEAIIATGSNNTATHFDYYFKHVPRIIRRNRNGVAVLHGDETKEKLRELGHDVFNYFGLGCRNVSKLYVPEEYDFNLLMETFHEFNELVLHNKYKNNFDYNYAIYLLNQDEFLSNGCIIVKESTDIASRIAMLGYERYASIQELATELSQRKDEIQCIVSDKEIDSLQTILPGVAQQPALNDYADGIDTLSFLLELT